MKIAVISVCEETARSLCKYCSDLERSAQIKIFHNPDEGLVYVVNDWPDLVFLDVDMPQRYGWEIARSIRNYGHDIELAFIAQSAEHVLSALDFKALSYMSKPVTLDLVEKTLAKLHKLHIPNVVIRTFGRFDVYIGNQTLYFKNAKAKELLALLVDKRGTVSMEMAVNVLWDNRHYDERVKQLYRKAVAYLHSLFRDYQIDIFVSNRGSCYVKHGTFSCDYYDLLNGNEEAITSYNGEYMFEYAWAESTLVQIENIVAGYEQNKNILPRNS